MRPRAEEGRRVLRTRGPTGRSRPRMSASPRAVRERSVTEEPVHHPISFHRESPVLADNRGWARLGIGKRAHAPPGSRDDSRDGRRLVRQRRRGSGYGGRILVEQCAVANRSRRRPARQEDGHTQGDDSSGSKQQGGVPLVPPSRDTRLGAWRHGMLRCRNVDSTVAHCSPLLRRGVLQQPRSRGRDFRTSGSRWKRARPAVGVPAIDTTGMDTTVAVPASRLGRAW